MSSESARLDRLEKLVAVLLEAPGASSAKEVQPAVERLLSIMRSGAAPVISRPELEMLIHEVRASLLLRSVRHDAAELQRRFDQLNQEIYEYLAADSIGVDTASAKLPRVLPVRVYLSNGSREEAWNVMSALQSLTNAFGFSQIVGERLEPGSWWGRFFARSQDVLSKPEVKERLEKLERAAEVALLHQPQAGVDEKQVRAVAELVKSLEKTETASLLVGSILFAKRTDLTGVSTIVARSLTQRQMLEIERNASLLTDPDALFKALDRAEEPSALAAGKDDPAATG